jgi:hypothetical protein
MLAPGEPTPTPPFAGYRLDPDAGTGGYVYEGPVFRATVHSDGTVSFKDRHASFAPLLGLPIPQPLPAGTRSIEGELRKLLGKQKRGKPARPTNTPNGAVGGVSRMSPNRPDMNDLCKYPNPCFNDVGPILVGVQGRFDLTDEIMRLVGDDPYRYEKARFLAATLQFRTDVGARNRRDEEIKALGDLPKRLRAIWNDPDRSSAEKRRTILEMKDEMDINSESGRKGPRIIDFFLGRQESQD